MCEDEFKLADAQAVKTVRSRSPRPLTGTCSNLNPDRYANLKSKRAAIKGKLTLFDKYISQVDQSDVNANIKNEINLRIESATEFYKRFDEIQTEIEENSIESELPNHLEYREMFEGQYFSLMASAKCLTQESSDCVKLGRVVPVSVKLPEIKLPVFDGSFDKWLEFRNSYVTIIHKRQDLDPIQKFHYLKSSLTGSALQVISALEFTATNYTHAWDLLESRFHNNRLLVQNHVKSLFCAPAANKECASQIRKLVDSVRRNLRALNSLNEPTESWDTLIIYMISSKLDPSTDREWETHKGLLLSDPRRDINMSLTLEELFKFLKNRADVLDMIKSNNKYTPSPSQSKSDESKQNSDNKKHQLAMQHTYSYASTQSHSKGSIHKAKQQRNTCCLCGGNHSLYTCASFLNMSVQDRWKLVTDKGLCRNCIRTNSHAIKDCAFGPCKLCHKNHNSLLHTDNEICSLPVNPQTMSKVAASYAQPSVLLNNVGNLSAVESRSVLTTNTLQPVLLSTALIEVADSDNRYHTARALLDNGSQNCFITEKLCKRLNIRTIQSTIRISGVGQSVSQSTQTCKINMRSKSCEFKTDMQCLVLPNITSKLPSIDVDIGSIRIPSHIQLADPTFNVSSEIDILIGADVFWDLLGEARIRLSSGPYLHDSKVGWLISGPVNNYNYTINTESIRCNFVQIDSQLRKFWELEEISNPQQALSKHDRMCEDLFAKTTTRDEQGRFLVQMPLKEAADSLGESYHMAKNRFLSLERKLERDPQYKKLYCDFLREYEELGHMSPVQQDIDTLKPYYILPHHGVLRESSTTTKLRVVFDASATTTSKKSLNDIQCAGPPLQNEIFSILLRFRQYPFVASADIQMFFRQIAMQSEFRDLQLIMWRASRDMPLQLYRLNTVTYGTTSAPYLSIRCLKQLAMDCEDLEVARTISDDFYVDDLLTGNNDLGALLDICHKTSEVLKGACFPLRKWMFNSTSSETTKDLAVGEHCQTKTLGLGWSNKVDELCFTTTLEQCATPITKRHMLSVISQIYDPLGLLTPAVIKAKVMLQRLWLSKLDWDDEVPTHLASDWHNFVSGFSCLHNIRVPRYILTDHTHKKQLHIFTDSSQGSFGACAYIRSFNEDYTLITIRLLCAKSKLAPLKTISIPRLELCGALVGAKLYQKIIKSLRLAFEKVYFWTDSTIVQGWIRMSPHLLKTFVANRVAQINDLTGDMIWRHVRSAENPADLLSRGVKLDSLKYNETHLWWGGPQFLREPDANWSGKYEEPICTDLPEIKNVSVNLHTINSTDLIDFDRFSSFTKMQRAGAYVLRFIHNARCPSARLTGSLSVDDLNSAVRMLSRAAQRQSFAEEYDNLESNLPVKVKKTQSVNKISGLNVFMDSSAKVIRIGGRLSNATNFNYDKKYPILLSGSHRFSVLLFTHEHHRMLHAGPQLLVYTLREKWWVLGARNLARRIVHRCVTCARLKGQTVTPIMGNLPSERLDCTFPFMQCGNDMCGPFLIKNRRGRGATLIKCYVCIFVCYTTRAIHLELVGSLTTQDYLLALKRFISKRGKPNQIFSDNGRNFVGAEKELAAVLDNSLDILDFAGNQGIKLSFNPPYGSHFGGLFEAGVKSCKHHLRRVMGNAKLVYEEFSTVLTQIEAVLNSRPLSPLSADPTDYLPLTPAHFLIGRPLTAPPCEDLSAEPAALLDNFRRMEQLRQHFWERWAKEYISELQVRTKWKSDGDNIAVNDLVVIKDDNLPPLRWKLGRIVRVIPGKDGITRVAEIRTATGVILRTCTKICPLPVQPTCESKD